MWLIFIYCCIILILFSGEEWLFSEAGCHLALTAIIGTMWVFFFKRAPFGAGELGIKVKKTR